MRDLKGRRALYGHLGRCAEDQFEDNVHLCRAPTDRSPIWGNMLYDAIKIFWGFVGRLVGVKEVSPQIKVVYGWVKRKNQRRVLLMDVKASEKV